MSTEEFLQWIRQRLDRESLAAVGLSLGVSDVCVLHWSRGARRPLEPVLRLADFLTQGGIELAPGLPAGKPYRPRKSAADSRQTRGKSA
jgi:hypothetical protein